MKTELLGETCLPAELDGGDIFIFFGSDQQPQMGLMCLAPAAHREGLIVNLSAEGLPVEKFTGVIAVAPVFKFPEATFIPFTRVETATNPTGSSEPGSAEIIGTEVYLRVGKAKMVSVSNGKLVDTQAFDFRSAIAFKIWSIAIRDERGLIEVFRFPSSDKKSKGFFSQ